LDVDAKRRDLLTELEGLKALKNQVSKEFPKLSPEEKKLKLLEMKEVDEKMESLKTAVELAVTKYQELMYLVPNIPSQETPIGKGMVEKIVRTPIPFWLWHCFILWRATH
jgi:seryl-tRNA synthetase